MKLDDKTIADAYRDASQEGPPEALDAAIRAAARRAVGAGPRAARPGWLHRYRAPLALAATLVLALGVAIKVRDSGEAEITAVTRPEPAAQPAPAEPEAPKAVMQEPPTPATPHRDQRPDPAPAAPVPQPIAKQRARGAESAVASEPRAAAVPHPEVLAQPAPPAPPPPVQMRAEEATPPSVAPPSAADRADQPRPAPVPASPLPPPPVAFPAPQELRTPSAGRDRAMKVAPETQERIQGSSRRNMGGIESERQLSSSVDAAANRTPDQWVEEIRRLRSLARTDEATQALAELKRRFPDFVLPDDLK